MKEVGKQCCVSLCTLKHNYYNRPSSHTLTWIYCAWRIVLNWSFRRGGVLDYKYVINLHGESGIFWESERTTMSIIESWMNPHARQLFRENELTRNKLLDWTCQSCGRLLHLKWPSLTDDASRLSAVAAVALPLVCLGCAAANVRERMVVGKIIF